MCTHKTVATLSQRCFEEAEGIMHKWEEGSWTNQKTTRVSQSLFRELNSDGIPCMVHYIFRKRVNDLRASGVDFNQHLYVPEVSDGEEPHFDREDHGHVLKRLTACVRSGNIPGLGRDAPPCQERYRRIPPALYQEVKDHVADMAPQVAALQQATRSQKATPHTSHATTESHTDIHQTKNFLARHYRHQAQATMTVPSEQKDAIRERNKEIKERQDQGLVFKPYNMSIHGTEEEQQDLKLKLKTVCNKMGQSLGKKPTYGGDFTCAVLLA
ncbi:hypothetical protein Bbelb_349580 [Branchiostoma belcheri]|nr:hypothetical protein Bbelb_349580 [Branchiostoma belcheri]